MLSKLIRRLINKCFRRSNTSLSRVRGSLNRIIEEEEQPEARVRVREPLAGFRLTTISVIMCCVIGLSTAMKAESIP